MATRVLVPILIIILISCRGGPKDKQEPHGNSVTINDITVDFDGKLLTGWEVTNFGPQGPVYVSDGQIILGMGEGCTGITWKGDFPTADYEVSLDAKRIERK